MTLASNYRALLALRASRKKAKPKRVPRPRKPRSALNSACLAGMSTAEATFAKRWAAVPDAPNLVTQHRFHETRQWRFDFANVRAKVAIEIDGGMWRGTKGAHTSAKGATRDREKDMTASLAGWTVFRLTPAMLEGRNGGWSRLNRIAAFIRSRLTP